MQLDLILKLTDGVFPVSSLLPTEVAGGWHMGPGQCPGFVSIRLRSEEEGRRGLRRDQGLFERSRGLEEAEGKGHLDVKSNRETFPEP